MKSKAQLVAMLGRIIFFLEGKDFDLGITTGINMFMRELLECFLCEYKLLHVLITHQLSYSFTVTDLRPSRSRRLRFSFLVCKKCVYINTLFGLNDCGSNVRQLQEEALGSSS